MPPPRLVEGGQRQLSKKLAGDWELRYSFYRDHPVSYSNLDEPRGTWIDDDGTLCCVMGDHLYKYNTANKDNKHNDKDEVGGSFLTWDQKLRLPPPPSGDNRQWRIYGGYRPTLVSPRDIGAQDHDDESFEGD
ncbi:hypothetical protein ZWY2020_023766 [Hordeum vulgare]|nr:hypothetical protein ZWY2020_023766 [Hordeum vulgare]